MICQLGDSAVTNLNDYRSILSACHVGEELRVYIYRDGRQYYTDVTLTGKGESPSEIATEQMQNRNGIDGIRFGRSMEAPSKPFYRWQLWGADSRARRNAADANRLPIKRQAPIASVAALTAQPLAALPPYGSASPYGGERPVQGYSTAKRALVYCCTT